MGKWLRTVICRWLGVSPLGVKEKAPEEPKLSIAANVLHRAGESLELLKRRLEPPTLSPQVRGNFIYNKNDDPGLLGEPMLAFDDATTAPAWAYLNQINCGLGFAGYGYLAELSQRSEYRAPTETIASEATREWIDITVKGKASKTKRKQRGEKVEEAEDSAEDGSEDKIEKLEALMEEMQLREHFRKISEKDGFFGRAQLFIDVQHGSTPSEEARQLPLVVDPKSIPKGSLRGFKVIEPMWTTPYTYNATDPTRQDFYKPRAWFVMGQRTHASRLLTFISREVPDMLKPAYNFGGLSTSQLMEPYVYQWLRTRNAVSDLVHNFSIIALKTKMQDILSGDEFAGEGLMSRIELFKNNRDNQGLMLLDKDKEELEAHEVSLANLDKLQAQAQEHMAAPSHIPLVKLTGITPDGLNASSEGEIQVWYDHIRAYQKFFFQPHLMHVLKIMQLHLFGSIDDAIGIEWVPLSSPTIKELSEIRKANSETDDKYVAMGAVSPEEVRERLASDPTSGYDNLDLSKPPPTPPSILESDNDAENQETGAQAEHKRGEKTAQADHRRNLEVQAAANKAKDKGPKK